MSAGAEPAAQRPSPARGYLQAALCAAFAGAAPVTGKVGLAEARPMAFAFWLFAFAVLFTGAWAAWERRGRSERMRRRELLLACAHAALSFVAVWCFWSGVQRVHPAVASFLGRSETLLSIGLGIALLGERFHRLEALGGAVAIAGIALMKLPLGADPPSGSESAGYWLVLGGAACFGSAELFSKLAVRRVSPVLFVFVRNALCLALFAAAAAATGALEVPSPRLILSAATTALLATTLARTLFTLALRSIDLAKAAIINQSQPLFAALLSLVVLSELPRPLEWAGGALVLAGCTLLVLGARRGRAALSAPQRPARR